VQADLMPGLMCVVCSVNVTDGGWSIGHRWEWTKQTWWRRQTAFRRVL